MKTVPASVTLSVEEQLSRLSDLSLPELKARWLELKGVPLPKFMRRGLMTRAVAYAIQEAAFGGLDPTSRKRLDALAAQIVPTGAKPPPRPNRVKPGTRLVREWKGRIHDVMVLEDGFAWKGKRYASLSVIARAITGTRWNGWVFFGLKQQEERRVAGTALPAAVAKVRQRDVQRGAGGIGGANAGGRSLPVRDDDPILQTIIARSGEQSGG